MKKKKEVKPMHQGVGLLIANEDYTRFFIQQKDETYPFEEWRGCCSYWGGAIEPTDADEWAAVWRELEEELPQTLPILKKKGLLIKGKYKVATFDSSFDLTVFEVLLTEKQLDSVAKTKVLEGRGLLLSRAEALAQKWIWKTDFIFQNLNQLKTKG